MADRTAPHLESFDDIIKGAEEIKDWALANPVDDHIYKFNKPEWTQMTLSCIFNMKTLDACVAGSAALHHIYGQLYPTRQQKWTPTDVDIFFLSQGKDPSRIKMGMVDIIRCPEQTVEELLLNFDFPVCRVAYNFTGDIFISAQCIYALHTRRQNLP